MNDMPQWWLYASLAFFIVNAAFFVALIVVLLRFQAILKDLHPKLTETADRIEEASKKIAQTADSAKKTVDHVGSKARNVADGIEAVAMVSAKRFQTLSMFFTATSTVLKLYQMVKSNKAEKTKVDKKALNKDNRDSNRGVEQSGSSSGS